MSKVERPGVLFDMDGVLVDSEPVITAAAVEGLRRYQVPAQPEDFKPFTGMGEDRFIGGVAEKYGVPYVTAMKDLVYDIYGEMVDAQLTVYPATAPTLKQLRALGFPMALASSADLVKITHNLRVASIPFDTFDHVVSGNDVTRKKPFPDIYLYAAEKISLPPVQCVVVEDAVSGVQAAKAAGMRAIGITTSFSREALFTAGADWVVDDIGQIVDILKSL